MSTAFDSACLRSGCEEELLTALCADLFFREQIVSHDRLPKRCAFGPIVPLNLRRSLLRARGGALRCLPHSRRHPSAS